jgi:hypothetical protein
VQTVICVGGEEGKQRCAVGVHFPPCLGPESDTETGNKRIPKSAQEEKAAVRRSIRKKLAAAAVFFAVHQPVIVLLLTMQQRPFSVGAAVSRGNDVPSTSDAESVNRLS